MTDPAAQQLLDRVARYVGGASDERFDELARAAFAFQVERIAPVRALAEAREVTPEAVRSWHDVPPVPALAYKSLDLHPAGLAEVARESHEGPSRNAVDAGGCKARDGRATQAYSTVRRGARASATPQTRADPALQQGPREIPGLEVFRSSGTSQAARSVHRHVFPGLYRAVIDASFPRVCLPHSLAGRSARVPMLSLIPPRHDAPDSSLSFMIEHVIARWGGESSVWAFGAGGLDAVAAARWCRRAEMAGRPVLVLATAFALATWLDALPASGDRFRLPPGSVLFETGGFKGRTRELSRPELLARVEERLGVPSTRVVREYGMTELTSQLYTAPGGELFLPPPWVRVRVLDPETLEDAPPGEAGLIAIFDLANLSSAVHLLTEDLGAMEPLAGDARSFGLRLLGRAAGAELRGCSLTAEAMAAS